MAVIIDFLEGGGFAPCDAPPRVASPMPVFARQEHRSPGQPAASSHSDNQATERSPGSQSVTKYSGPRIERHETCRSQEGA